MPALNIGTRMGVRIRIGIVSGRLAADHDAGNEAIQALSAVVRGISTVEGPPGSVPKWESRNAQSILKLDAVHR